MADRTQGNPNTRPTDREAGRIGRDRNPSDIPAQAGLNPSIPIVVSQTVATYRIGTAKPPTIRHDDGFLALGKRSPTAADYVKLAKWKVMLEGAEALRSDLVDALAAYRHFLEGNGKNQTFSYDRFIINDRSGRVILENAIIDFKAGVVQLWVTNPSMNSFDLTGTAIPCGGVGNSRFPYPATENWQKAIGAHFIWLSGNVTVTTGTERFPAGMKSPRFRVNMALHAEDRYNFNPGAADIATGIPDSDNGIFEMTGLAKQYNQYATLLRSLQWEGIGIYASPAALQATERHRQPTNNHRLRNRF